MAVDRRKLIVEAAAQSFALFGYKATTMDQVAKLANVGKGTIYTFFSNKEELFDEIMNLLIREIKQVADAEYDADRTFFDNLNRILHRILDFREKHQLAVKLAHEVRDMGTPKAIEGLNKLEEAIIGYIQAKIQIAIDKRELKPCDPKITAFVMLKLYLALASEWQHSHEALAKEKIAELFKLYLLDGLTMA
ncbi:TetR/AcrR family transcriptional regulator [Cohnella terricola]|uniref:TetR/AcrR family transcriptional regulator n=1 Tax=Cohnella terricola TaxID=1289167 RepID=A0A559JB82_9BACL|nr:TetR/AcrR family transcriptional regulator [Cohnella terricola]TVX97138.1 TetR/AcrR family transcriptional regulator [Cohnella terricola]